MKKMKNLGLILVLAFIALFAFSACGEDKPGNTDDPTNPAGSDFNWDYKAASACLDELKKGLPEWPAGTASPLKAGVGYMDYSQTVTGISGAAVNSFISKLQENGFTLDEKFDISETRSLFILHEGKRCYTIDCNSNAQTAVLEMSAFTGIRDWTKEDVFKDTPLPNGAEIANARSVGGGEYLLIGISPSEKGFESYIGKLKDAGYTVFAENVSDDGLVYCTTLQKDRQLMVATYAKKTKKLYLHGSLDYVPSSHLLSDGANSDLKAGAKTTLYCIPVKGGQQSGNAFILQLKNGHFICYDGGVPADSEVMVRQLKQLAGGEKPHVEAWFITHWHGDHAHALASLLMSSGSSNDLTQEITVDGVYFQEPDTKALGFETSCRGALAAIVELPSKVLKTADGNPTPCYRIHPGEVYYFADMKVEVIGTLSLVEYDNYTTDNNNCSSGFMMYIEGQTVLNIGDMEAQGIQFAIDWHNDDFFHNDVHCSVHHSINYGTAFRKLVYPDVILDTNPDEDWLQRLANKHGNTSWVPNFAEIKNRCIEFHNFQEGVVAIEFPHTPVPNR